MYPCDQCDYKAHLPAGLREHKDLKHGKDRHFCDQCDIKHHYIITLELTRILHALSATTNQDRVPI